MAEQTLASAGEWQKVRRVHRTARFNPVVTIRRSGAIALSSDFVRKAGIADCTRASLFLSADGFRLAMQFHCDEADDDAFVLSRDGGRVAEKGQNRLITAMSLLSQAPNILSLVKEDGPVRRYEPAKNADGLWVVHLAPSFDRVLSQLSDVSAGATGIYRYMLGSETIYIGRGVLRDRLSAAERRSWDFDRVEYSILNSDAAERRWESFWLNEYRRRHGRWPIHNRVAGVGQSRTAVGA